MRRQLTSKISLIAASVLTLGTCLPAGVAFADPNQPGTGTQSGTGSTALTMVWEDPNAEYGGTEDPNNPMEITDTEDPNYDATAPGKNLSFKAPTAINFVAKANGQLMAPQSGIHIDNYSAYGIRVSSMKVDQSTGWNIVADASASSDANAVSGNIGPATDQLSWASYVPEAPSTDPIAVTKDYAWNMAATDGVIGGNDELALTVTDSKVANLNMDLSTAKTFGTIHWYLKAGNAAEPAYTLPTSADFSNVSLTKLSAIGNYLRGDGKTDTDYIAAAKELAQSGPTLTATLNDNTTTATMRLVDASVERGLVFQFDFTSKSCLGIQKMNSLGSNTGGWTSSEIRTLLNSGTLYTTKLSEMKIAGEVVDPVAIPATAPLSSLDYNGGSPQVITTSGDKFWLPSLVELYGTDAWATLNKGGYTGTENCTQFAYYAQLAPGVLQTENNPLAIGGPWWLRSASPSNGNQFMSVLSNGQAYNGNAGSDGYILPCFCL